MKANSFAQVASHWEDVIEDMEATAGEYRDRDWETLELHPGDVTPLEPNEHSDRYGLDVLVPGSEFEELQSLVEAGTTFDSYQVFRGRGSGFTLVLVVMEDTEGEQAVLFPAFFGSPQSDGMREAALERGAMHSHVRPLDKRATVTFTHDEPALFFGEADEGDDDESHHENE